MCTICKELKKVRKRYKNRKVVCETCYLKKLRPKKKCHFCGKKKSVASYIDKEKKLPVCHGCYQKKIHNRPKRKCHFCGEKKAIQLRTKDNKLVCNACFNKKGNGYCPKCGRKRILLVLKKCFVCFKREKRESKLNSVNVKKRQSF